MNENKVPENRAFKVTLILLVGLAAFSTAMKDLNRLQVMVGSVQEFTSQWRGTDLAMLNVDSITANKLCPNDSRQLINSFPESGVRDGNAQAIGNEIEGIDCETIAEPEVGGKVEPVVNMNATRSAPRLGRARNVPTRNLKDEISARRREGHWPVRFEYKTFDRSVTLDLPMTMITDIKADALETDSPDFPVSLLGRMSRKQLHGKTDNGRRELILKRFERNISFRRAS
jgi:hypothetical protein